MTQLPYALPQDLAPGLPALSIVEGLRGGGRGSYALTEALSIVAQPERRSARHVERDNRLAVTAEAEIELHVTAFIFVPEIFRPIDRHRRNRGN